MENRMIDAVFIYLFLALYGPQLQERKEDVQHRLQFITQRITKSMKYEE